MPCLLKDLLSVLNDFFFYIQFTSEDVFPKLSESRPCLRVTLKLALKMSLIPRSICFLKQRECPLHLGKKLHLPGPVCTGLADSDQVVTILNF